MEFKSHAYAVDAINSCKELEKLTRENYTRKGLKREEYLDNLKVGIRVYCKNHGLNFSFYFDNNLPLVIPSDHPFYDSSLGLALVSFDPHTIGRFLDYQQKHYKGKENFLNLVEFVAYPIARDSSPFENSERLDRIINWIEKKRSAVRASTSSPTQKLYAWSLPDKLDEFSHRLYHRNYTENPKAFSNAINKGSQCKWNKDIESLVYLFFLLKDKKVIRPIGTKAYLKNLLSLFDIASMSKDQMNLRDLLYRVKNDDKKYSKIRQSVKDLIKPLI